MRTFEISVSDDKVACDPLKMHVAPHAWETFGVKLDRSLEHQYKLKISLSRDPSNCLKKQRLSSSAYVLEDHNKAIGEPKFSIELVPLPETGAKDVDALDPIFVNE
jgi:hypothetical protein